MRPWTDALPTGVPICTCRTGVTAVPALPYIACAGDRWSPPSPRHRAQAVSQAHNLAPTWSQPVSSRFARNLTRFYRESLLGTLEKDVHPRSMLKTCRRESPSPLSLSPLLSRLGCCPVEMQCWSGGSHLATMRPPITDSLRMAAWKDRKDWGPYGHL